MKPATPLPEFKVEWFYDSAAIKDGDGKRIVLFKDSTRANQFAQIIDRANAYPALVAALRDTLTACERSIDFNIRHGSGVAQARDLLRSLGEL